MQLDQLHRLKARPGSESLEMTEKDFFTRFEIDLPLSKFDSIFLKDFLCRIGLEFCW